MTAVSATRAHRVRRRSASNRVSRTMRRDERGARSSSDSASGSWTMPEEPLLERRAPRLDRVDRPAGGDDRRDELRDPVRAIGWIASQSPSSVSGPNRARPARAAGVEAGRADPHGVLAEQLLERAGRHDPTGVDDRHPVADELDLGQQMRVQEDGRPAITGGPDDPPHVGPADRVERRCRLVEQDELGLAEQRAPRPRRCCIPFENVPTRSSARSASPTVVERRVDLRPSRPGRRSRPARSGGRGPRGRAATAGSGTAPAGSRPAGAPRRSPSGRPGACRCPRSARASPRNSLTEVVLPAPFGPRKPNTSPCSTRIDRPASAVVRP